MADPKFGTWVVPESPVDVEYSLLVIEEIRQVVADGFQRLQRGGIEVGGVLYGTREIRTVRILAMRVAFMALRWWRLQQLQGATPHGTFASA